MNITFLGTGTSVGVPVIECDCPVCTSSDPRNRRSRASICVEADGVYVIVDTSVDFREQVIANKIPRVDAVLFTHAHADHIFGFDDIRRYNTIQDSVIPAYAADDTMADLKRIFDYISEEKVPGFYRPRIEFIEINDEFDIGGIHIIPLDVVHGPKRTQGFLFQHNGASAGYFPDCYSMPDDAFALLKGIDVMILDALRYTPHKTHLTLPDSVALLQRISAKKSFITHMCHDLDHAKTQESLPESINVPYDGLKIKI